MKLREFRLLTDENLHGEVTQWLAAEGFDVLTVEAAGLEGATDQALVRRAARDQRVIVTHDADFGTLAILQHEPIVGIVYLRPGHIDARFTIETLSTLLHADPDVTPPFVVVARRSGNDVSMRVRHIQP
jgi:predicted nuclease of predicted toxin-antitoxin system